MDVTPEIADDIAQVLYAAMRAFNHVRGVAPGPPWSSCNKETKRSFRIAVMSTIADNNTPKEAHEAWVEKMRKTEQAVPKMLPWDDLREEDRQLVRLSHGVVRALTPEQREEYADL